MFGMLPSSLTPAWLKAGQPSSRSLPGETASQLESLSARKPSPPPEGGGTGLLFVGTPLVHLHFLPSAGTDKFFGRTIIGRALRSSHFLRG